MYGKYKIQSQQTHTNMTTLGNIRLPATSAWNLEVDKQKNKAERVLINSMN